MGMDIYVYAAAEDENVELKRIAWQACKDAGIDPPEELVEMFERFESPNLHQLTRNILERPLYGVYEHEAVSADPDREFGTRIYLDKLPPGTEYILIDVSV